MRLLTIALLVVTSLTVVACGNDDDEPAPAPTPVTEPTETPTPEEPAREPTPPPTETPTPELARGDPGEGDVEVEVVASGLEVPWGMAFTPDGRIFVAERPGRVRVIEDGELLPEPVVEPPVTHHGEGGLLGLALDPDFEQEPYLYTKYTYTDTSTGEPRNRVSRFTVADNQAGDERVLVDDIPADAIHNGGRVAFGPDGMLYVTTGDAAVPGYSQDPENLAGAILRLDPDGAISEDNPFDGSPVYSYGHRNAQGLAWHPHTGDLVSTEHGDIARDEVNLIEAGENYGWPEVEGVAGHPDYTDPIIESGTDVTWAPSGAAFVIGDALPEEWQGLFVFATLRGQHLHWMWLEEPYENGEAIQHGRLFEGEFGRLRTVKMGPDGYLYFTTSNRDQWGDEPRPNDDHIFRLVPAE